MKNVAIVVPTHHNPLAPSTGLVETILMDLFEKYPCMKDSPIYITYDMNTYFTNSRKYLDNLGTLASRVGNCFLFFKEGDTRKDNFYYCRGNLRAGILEAVTAVKEEFILFLEHDWLFVPGLPFEAILDRMVSSSGVHLIRFAQKDVIKCSTHFVPTDAADPLLTRSDYFGANPFFSKTELWHRLLIPLLKISPFPEGFAQEFEVALGTAYQDDRLSLGAEQARNIWGIFMYGHIGEEPTIIHLNGNVYMGPLKSLVRT